jgi:hypothetical protein
MERIKELKVKFPTLVSAEIEFNGSGDEGNCEVQDTTWVDDEEGGDVDNKLREIAYDLLEENYGGWELNDGSDGIIKIDFVKGTVKITYAQFETVRSEETQTEFGF